MGIRLRTRGKKLAGSVPIAHGGRHRARKTLLIDSG
jgi:hypothetical protein